VPLYFRCGVIGLTHNRRSQGGDVLLLAGFATRVAGCKHVCTRFSLHADSFAPSHLHPHPMRCFFFVGWVAWAWRGLPDVRYACKRASQRLQHASLRTFHTWRWSRRWWRIPTPRGRPHGRNESCFCECIYVLRDGRMVGERVKK
jgi:hypothetical protein